MQPDVAHCLLCRDLVLFPQWFICDLCIMLCLLQVHRCFKLHVESCRKAGHTALGLAAVTLWLRALRSQVSQQMAEPVAQWVRLKIDGARNGDEDLRLQ